MLISHTRRKLERSLSSISFTVLRSVIILEQYFESFPVSLNTIYLFSDKTLRLRINNMQLLDSLNTKYRVTYETFRWNLILCPDNKLLVPSKMILKLRTYYQDEFFLPWIFRIVYCCRFQTISKACHIWGFNLLTRWSQFPQCVLITFCHIECLLLIDWWTWNKSREKVIRKVQ